MTEQPYFALAVLGLTFVSVVNRSFFFVSRRELPLPALVQRGLRYAPLAALMAVIAPEIVVSGTSWLPTADPRPLAALVAALYAVWRRDILGTLVVGMAVYAALRWSSGLLAS